MVKTGLMSGTPLGQRIRFDLTRKCDSHNVVNVSRAVSTDFRLKDLLKALLKAVEVHIPVANNPETGTLKYIIRTVKCPCCNHIVALVQVYCNGRIYTDESRKAEGLYEVEIEFLRSGGYNKTYSVKVSKFQKPAVVCTDRIEIAHQ